MLLDDLHSSILERIVVSLNDTVIEDISHVNDLHKVLTYAHVNRSYYQNEMHGCQGAYKYTPGFHGKTGTNNDVYTSENDFVMRIDATSPGSDSINPYYDGRTAITNDYICVSLSTLLGLGRGYNGLTQLFPLRFVNELQISITLAQGHRALVAYLPATSGTAPGKSSALNTTYSVENLFLVYTAVQLDQGYYERFQQMLMTQGFVSFYDSYYAVAKKLQVCSILGMTLP